MRPRRAAGRVRRWLQVAAAPAWVERGGGRWGGPADAIWRVSGAAVRVRLTELLFSGDGGWFWNPDLTLPWEIPWEYSVQICTESYR